MFGRPQVIENRTQRLLLRTDILQRKAARCPRCHAFKTNKESLKLWPKTKQRSKNEVKKAKQADFYLYKNYLKIRNGGKLAI